MLEQSHHSHSTGLTRYPSTLPSPSGRSNLQHAKRTSTISTLQQRIVKLILLLVTFPMFLMKFFHGFRKAYSHQ